MTDPKCCICNVILHQTTGPKLELHTQLAVQTVTRLLGKVVSIGDTLCNKCRSAFYRKEFSQEAGPSHGRKSPDSTYKPVLSKPQPSPELIEMDFPRVLSTHKYCFLCRSTDKIVVVPFEARQQIFSHKRIFVPKGNRCCQSHLIKNRIYEDELELIQIFATKSSIEVDDLKHFLVQLSVSSEANIIDKIGEYTLSEERLKVFTGLTYDNIQELQNMLTSLKKSTSRNETQAIVTFLFKLRTGNSNKQIAAAFGLAREEQVSEFSNSVIQAFEKDVLPIHLGFHAKSREDLIENQTSRMAKTLHNINNRLALIFDGTYVHHQKSANNEYQRRSYSVQKKKPLCKPFSIVTTNGYIVDTLGPFSANQNDANIMELILNDPNGLRSLIKPGDICIVDRGFRDIKDKLTDLGYTVLMPALKGTRKQLTTAESNESRFITKLRWAVEAIHGILGEKYQLLHKQLDNKLLPKLSSYCRIASFLNNKFGKRLESDVDLFDQIVSQMWSKK